MAPLPQICRAREYSARHARSYALLRRAVANHSCFLGSAPVLGDVPFERNAGLLRQRSRVLRSLEQTAINGLGGCGHVRAKLVQGLKILLGCPVVFLEQPFLCRT